MIRNARFHRRRYAQRFVDTAKVVVGIPQHDGRCVVLPLLAERVCKPSESTYAHSQAEIGPLDDRRADALGIRPSVNWDHLHGLYFGGTVAFLIALRSAVNLDELREAAQAIMQRRDNGGTVRREAIGRHLKRSTRCRVAHAFNENVRGALIALTDCHIQHEFGMAFNRDERVAVA